MSIPGYLAGGLGLPMTFTISISTATEENAGADIPSELIASLKLLPTMADQ